MNDQINNSINGVIYCYIRLSCFLICFSELSHCCCKKKKKKRKAINGKYVVNSKIMQNFIVSKKYSKMETI